MLTVIPGKWYCKCYLRKTPICIGCNSLNVLMSNILNKTCLRCLSRWSKFYCSQSLQKKKKIKMKVSSQEVSCFLFVVLWPCGLIMFQHTDRVSAMRLGSCLFPHLNNYRTADSWEITVSFSKVRGRSDYCWLYKWVNLIRT